MKYSTDEMQNAYNEMAQKERPILAFVGAIAGSLPAAALYFLMGQMGGVFLLMLLLPAAVIGIFARFTGFPYRLKPRLVIGALAFILHILGCWALQLNPLAYLLAPACAGVAIITSKVKLSRIQEFTLGQVEIGKLSLSSKPKP